MLYRDRDVVAENLVIQHRDLSKFNHLNVKNILLLKNHPQVIIVLARPVIQLMYFTLCILLTNIIYYRCTSVCWVRSFSYSCKNQRARRGIRVS